MSPEPTSPTNTLKRNADEAEIKEEQPAKTLTETTESNTKENDTPPETVPAITPAITATDETETPASPSASSPKTSSRKNSNKGRHGDPRMHRAVAARLMNPELSLLEALLEGGFNFPEGTEGSGKSDRNIFDQDGVLLCQRKNQLSRRLRLAKKRQQASRTDGNMFSPNGGAQSQDSRSLQNMLLNGQLPPNANQMPMMPPHQFVPPFFPGQPVPGVMDPAMMNGNDARTNKVPGMDGNLDQYLQQTARNMGLRPDQFQQSLRQATYPNQGMFPGYPANGMPFQQFPGMPNQPAAFMANPAMDQQQRNVNPAMDANGAPTPAANGMNAQNMQMPAMMAMQQQQQQQQHQYNSDIGRMIFNRQLLNIMEQQQQQQSQTQQQQGQPQAQPPIQGQPLPQAQPPALAPQEQDQPPEVVEHVEKATV